MTATPTATAALVTPVVAADLIDEYGAVTQLRDDFAPTERLYQQLKARIAALYADAEPEREFMVKGLRFELKVSMCSMESTPDVPRIRKRLGAATFLAVVDVTKKALEAWLLKPEIEDLFPKTRTGSRSYAPTAIPKK